MKNEYKTPFAEVIEPCDEDILTASPGTTTPPVIEEEEEQWNW